VRCRAVDRHEQVGFLAPFGRGAMSELSPLSGAKRKLDFGAVRAAFDPERTYPAPITPSLKRPMS